MTNEMRTSLQASFGKLEVSDLVPSVMCVLASMIQLFVFQGQSFFQQ